MKKLNIEKYSTRILTSNEEINILGGSDFFNDLMHDIGSIVGDIVIFVNELGSNPNLPIDDGTAMPTNGLKY